jgi:hypothetical protein
MGEGVCSLCSRDRFFADERKLLKARRSGEIANVLMLPTAFYLSKNRNREDSSTYPSEELIKRLDGPLKKLTGSVHECNRFSPFFVDPLRIFTYPNAHSFTNIAEHTAERIVNNGQLEVFRIAARRFVKERPYSLSCLLLTLVLAERLTPHVLIDRIALFIANQSVGGGGVDAPTLTFSDCEQDLWWSDEEQN